MTRPRPSVHRRPVVMLVFANDRYGDERGYLRNLAAERRAVEDAFEAVGDSVRLVVEPNATPERLFDLLDTHGEALIGLHYGGHAEGAMLQLEDEQGRPSPVFREGFAARLGRIPTLRWVFLNGCATAGHVDAVHAGCRVPVIATDRAIEDGVATRFARRFYHNLCSGASLQEAFDRTADALDGQYGRPEKARRSAADAPRHLGRSRARPLFEGWPWALCTHAEAPDATAWCLPSPVIEAAARRRRRGLLGAAAGAALIAAVLVALWPREPADAPAPDAGPPLAAVDASPAEAGSVESAPASLVISDPRRDDEGLSVRIDGPPPDAPVDAHLDVRCGRGEVERVDLVPAASPTPARRRFVPVFGRYPVVMPDPRCDVVLEVAAGAQSARRALRAERGGGQPRVLLYRPEAGEGAFDDFRTLFGRAVETAGAVVWAALGSDIPVFIRPAPPGRTTDRATASRLVAIGGLLQIVWPSVADARRLRSTVFMRTRLLAGAPAQGAASAGGGADPLHTVEHLSPAHAESYAITHDHHVLLLLVGLADEARDGPIDVEARFLGALRAQAVTLLARIDRLDPAGFDPEDRAILGRLRDEVHGIRQAVDARLGQLAEVDTRRRSPLPGVP